jgi:hypothetical protein
MIKEIIETPTASNPQSTPMEPVDPGLQEIAELVLRALTFHHSVFRKPELEFIYSVFKDSFAEGGIDIRSVSGHSKALDDRLGPAGAYDGDAGEYDMVSSINSHVMSCTKYHDGVRPDCQGDCVAYECACKFTDEEWREAELEAESEAAFLADEAIRECSMESPMGLAMLCVVPFSGPLVGVTELSRRSKSILTRALDRIQLDEQGERAFSAFTRGYFAAKFMSMYLGRYALGFYHFEGYRHYPQLDRLLFARGNGSRPSLRRLHRALEWVLEGESDLSVKEQADIWEAVRFFGLDRYWEDTLQGIPDPGAISPDRRPTVEAICSSLQRLKRGLREEEITSSYDTENPHDAVFHDAYMEHSREMIIKLQGRVDPRLTPR